MTKFEIEYKNGRGKFAVDLEQLLPCNASDFKRLLSFVSLSSDPSGNADKLFSFMACQVEDLKKPVKKKMLAVHAGKKKLQKLTPHSRNIFPMQRHFQKTTVHWKSQTTPQKSF